MVDNGGVSRHVGQYRLGIPTEECAWVSISKYDAVVPIYDRNAFALAITYTTKHLAIMGPSEVLSYKQAQSMVDPSTSVGIPMNKNFKSKAEFFSWCGAEAFCEQYWNMLRRCVWGCQVKKEIVKRAKILLSILRTYTASPIDHLMATVRLCGVMNANLYANALKTSSCVGMSKYHGQWNLLHRKLSTHPNCFECDETNYDASVFADLLFAIRDIRKGCIDPQFHTVLDWVYDDIVWSYICMPTGEVIRKGTGNPSGSGNTSADNTIALILLFYYAWIILSRAQGTSDSYEAFSRNVELAVYGDDNTYCVSDDVVEWFNAVSIARVWRGIGFFVRSDKWTSRVLTECSFLSSPFLLHKGVGVPGCNREKIFASLLYGTIYPGVSKWTLLRACALRIDSYWDLECRTFLSKFIQWLLTTEHASLHAEAWDDPMDFHTVWTVYKTDQEIEDLFLISESAVRHENKSLPAQKVFDHERYQTLEINIAESATGRINKPEEEILDAQTSGEDSSSCKSKEAPL